MNNTTTTRHEAELRMAAAKKAFTRAAMAALRGLPLAEAQTAVALEELAAARKGLAELAERNALYSEAVKAGFS